MAPRRAATSGLRKKGRAGPGRVLAEPAGWAALEQEEKAYLDAEVDRLLYVAATRAKDTLVVSRYGGKAGGRTPAWDALSAKMSGAPALVIPAAVAPIVPAAVDLSIAASTKATAAAEAAHERARQPSWSATSVTSESKRLPRLALESADAFDDTDPTRVVIPDTPSHRADAGMAWGSLVHGLLEHAMRHRTASREDLRRLALWLTVEEPQLRAVVDQAIEAALAVVSSDELKAAKTSGECHEEVPFAVRDQDGALPVVVNGAIDLVYREGDAWAVVDYKTDADAKDVDLRARHQRQLETYERAWTMASGKGTRARVLGVR